MSKQRKRKAVPVAGPYHVFRGGNFIKVVPEGYEDLIERTHYLGGAVCEMDNWTGKRHDSSAPWVLPTAMLLAASWDMRLALLAVRDAVGLTSGEVDALLDGEEVQITLKADEVRAIYVALAKAGD